VVRLRTRAGVSIEEVERATGLTADNLRLLARDRLRIQTYIDQRFGLTVPLTDEQVLQYYRAHPEEFTVNGQLTSFDRAQGLARERAGLEQRQRTISQWLRDLRARADVSVPAR
jgi:predicted transcriptional regulator